MELPPLGLYIHLPWCERKCPYCDFNSHEIQELPETQYIDALLQDLDTDIPQLHQREVATLFIGGGTPSLFSAPGIARLLKEARAELDENRRREMYHECQKIVRNEGGAIVYAFKDNVEAAGSKVKYANLSGIYEGDGAKAAERWWFKS